MIEEVGRHALPSPLIPTLSASFVLRRAGSEVAKRLMARIASGTTASLAVTNERGSWEPGDAPLIAHQVGRTPYRTRCRQVCSGRR